MPATPQTPEEREHRQERENRQTRATIRGLVDKSVRDAMHEQSAELTAYIDLKFAELKDTLLSAFPEGDPAGHRAFHEKQIEMMEERKKMFRSIREKTLAGIVWAGVVLLGTALLDYAKKRLLGMP